MFQIGDVVRVRSWDDMTSEYEVDDAGDIKIRSGVWFFRGRRYICGDEGIISSIEPDPFFRGYCSVLIQEAQYHLPFESLVKIESVSQSPFDNADWQNLMGWFYV